MAVIGTMTGREHLELYAAIKGVPTSKIPTTVQPMIEELGLGQYADKAAGGYSGIRYSTSHDLFYSIAA